MKALKYLSYVGKMAGLVAALDTMPFVDPAVGVVIFAAASLLKDTVNRIGDLADDGKVNQSFRAGELLSLTAFRFVTERLSSRN